MPMNVMPVEEIISRVTKLCTDRGAKKLVLIGSFAKGTQTPRSDVDLVVYGCDDFRKLEDEVDAIDTLRKIDLLQYESIRNPYLLEDIEEYGRKVYEAVPNV